MNQGDELAERKRLLVTQADLQRLQAQLAWHDARRIVFPPATRRASPRSRAVIATLLGLALPLFGAGRLRKIVRFAGIAATIFRVVRGLRGGR